MQIFPLNEKFFMKILYQFISISSGLTHLFLLFLQRNSRTKKSFLEKQLTIFPLLTYPTGIPFFISFFLRFPFNSYKKKTRNYEFVQKILLRLKFIKEGGWKLIYIRKVFNSPYLSLIKSCYC